SRRQVWSPSLPPARGLAERQRQQGQRQPAEDGGNDENRWHHSASVGMGSLRTSERKRSQPAGPIGRKRLCCSTAPFTHAPASHGPQQRPYAHWRAQIS